MSKDKDLFQDPIRQKMIGFIENVYEQKNNILNGVLIVGFVLAISILMKYSNDVTQDEANSEFGIAQNSYVSGLQDFALIEFNNIANEYPELNAGLMAELYIAADSFYNGNLENADTRLKNISGKFNVNALDANILGMRGDIALSKGDFDKALQLYIEAKNTCGLTNYKIKFQIGEMYALQANGEHERVVSTAEDLLGNDKISSTNKNIVEELKAFSQHYLL